MGERFEQIICSIDFSEITETVIDCGALMASRFNAALFIVHAICLPDDPFHHTALFERGGELERLRQSAREKISGLMKGKPLKWSCILPFGDPVEQVLQTAAKQKHGLIVAGSLGIKGITRFFTGTVMERMVKKSKTPILIVVSRQQDKEAQGLPLFENVVVCCGLPEQSSEILRGTAMLSECCSGSVHLVHALERPVVQEMTPAVKGPYQKVQEALVPRLHQQFADLAGRYLEAGIQVETRIFSGPPAEHIQHFIKDVQPDLVVVGVKDESAVGRFFAGSTTEAVIRGAKCCVLAVPVSSELLG